MRKVPLEELFIFDKDELVAETAERLLDFNRNYQIRVLKYFAQIKLDFERNYPGIVFPGLFGEIDSVSGKMRPLAEQRVWSWGDCRALGIWSYFLCKNVIPDREFEVSGRKINLRSFYAGYCDFIYEKLRERYELNGGYFPFLVDIATNKASDDPRNVPCRRGEYDPSHVFASSGFIQYGIMKDNPAALSFGLKILDETIECGMSFKNVDHITKERCPQFGQGFLMVTVGAMLDSLKCISYSANKEKHSPLSVKLVESAVKMSSFILKNYCNSDTGEFWEYNDSSGKPYKNMDGFMVCDPGHAAEACGFIAELSGFMGDSILKNEFIERTLRIVKFIHRSAYSPKGLMYKNIDIISRRGVADRVDSHGKEYFTAPWWNVCELASAALKLYQLTGDKDCLETYAKAHNACYLNYPNELIGGFMVQTLDAETGDPLPFNPATGNLDPMHSPRAREREIEILELFPF